VYVAGAGADVWLSKWENSQNGTEFKTTDEIQQDSIWRLGIYASIGASKVF